MKLRSAILLAGLSVFVAACDNSADKAEAETEKAPAAASAAPASSDASVTTSVPASKVDAMKQLKAEMGDLRMRYEAAQTEADGYRKEWEDTKAAIKDAEAKNDSAAVDDLTKKAAVAKLKMKNTNALWQQLRDQLKEVGDRMAQIK